MKKYILSIFLVFSFMIIHLSKEVEANTGFCDSAKIDACKKTPDDPDRASLARSYCEQLKANDKACLIELPFATAYTIVALACTIMCAGENFPILGQLVSPALEAVCFAGSLIVGTADVAAAVTVALSHDSYTKKASSMITQDWQIGGSATIAALGVVVAASTTNAFGGAAGFTVDTESQACVSAVLNTIQATVKWFDYAEIQRNSKLNQRRLGGFQAPELNLLRTNPTQGLNTASNSTPPVAAAVDGSGDVGGKSLGSQINDLNKKGDIASAITSGVNRGFLGTKDPKVIQKSINDFMNKTGLTPGDLSESALANGVGKTISDILAPNAKNPEEFKKKMEKMDSKISEWIKNYGNSLDGRFSSSLASDNKSPSSLNLAKNLKNRNPGSESAKWTSTINFSGFESDIWHAGTTKTIFEIVSEKTKSVSDRIGGN